MKKQYLVTYYSEHDHEYYQVIQVAECRNDAARFVEAREDCSRVWIVVEIIEQKLNAMLG